METSLNFLLAHCEQILSSLESPQNQNQFLNILETLLPAGAGKKGSVGSNDGKGDSRRGSRSSIGGGGDARSDIRSRRRVHPDWFWPALSKMILVVQSCESEEEMNCVLENILPLLKPGVYLKLQQLQTSNAGDNLATSMITDDEDDEDEGDDDYGFVTSPERIPTSKIAASHFNAWSVLKDSQRKANAKCVNADEIASYFCRRVGDPTAEDEIVQIQRLAAKIVAVLGECPQRVSSQNSFDDGEEDGSGSGSGVYQRVLAWITNAESRKLGSEALKLLPKMASLSKSASSITSGKTSSQGDDDNDTAGSLAFAVELAKIDSLDTLVEIMLYELDFENKVERCRSALDSIISSARDLRKNEDFCCLLDLLLRAVNVLNKQHQICNDIDGEGYNLVAGLRLNALLKIAATPAVNDAAVCFPSTTPFRSSTSVVTLLDVVVRQMHEAGKGDLVNFANRIPFLSDAITTPLKTVKKEVAGMSKINSKIHHLLSPSSSSSSSSKGTSSPLLPRSEKLVEFWNEVKSSLHFLTSEIEDAKRQEEELASFFCEDLSSFEIDNCLRIVHFFSVNCKQAEQKILLLHPKKGDEERFSSLDERSVCSDESKLLATMTTTTASIATTRDTLDAASSIIAVTRGGGGRGIDGGWSREGSLAGSMPTRPSTKMSHEHELRSKLYGNPRETFSPPMARRNMNHGSRDHFSTTSSARYQQQHHQDDESSSVSTWGKKSNSLTRYTTLRQVEDDPDYHHHHKQQQQHQQQQYHQQQLRDPGFPNSGDSSPLILRRTKSFKPPSRLAREGSDGGGGGRGDAPIATDSITSAMAEHERREIRECLLLDTALEDKIEARIKERKKQKMFEELEAAMTGGGLSSSGGGGSMSSPKLPIRRSDSFKRGVGSGNGGGGGDVGGSRDSSQTRYDSTLPHGRASVGSYGNNSYGGGSSSHSYYNNNNNNNNNNNDADVDNNNRYRRVHNGNNNNSNSIRENLVSSNHHYHLEQDRASPFPPTRTRRSHSSNEASTMSQREDHQHQPYYNKGGSSLHHEYVKRGSISSSSRSNVDNGTDINSVIRQISEEGRHMEALFSDDRDGSGSRSGSRKEASSTSPEMSEYSSLSHGDKLNVDDVVEMVDAVRLADEDDNDVDDDDEKSREILSSSESASTPQSQRKFGRKSSSMRVTKKEKARKVAAANAAAAVASVVPGSPATRGKLGHCPNCSSVENKSLDDSCDIDSTPPNNNNNNRKSFKSQNIIDRLVKGLPSSKKKESSSSSLSEVNNNDRCCHCEKRSPNSGSSGTVVSKPPLRREKSNPSLRRRKSEHEDGIAATTAASSAQQQQHQQHHQQHKPIERSQSGVTSPRSSLRREKSDASVGVTSGGGARNTPSFLSPTASSAAKVKKMEEADHGGGKKQPVFI